LILENHEKQNALNNESPTMHLLISPVLASLIWVGGGSVGLVLLIVIIVLVLRR
jgi:cellobiose-specific phosphotransferase system component IIC